MKEILSLRLFWIAGNRGKKVVMCTCLLKIIRIMTRRFGGYKVNKKISCGCEIDEY